MKNRKDTHKDMSWKFKKIVSRFVYWPIRLIFENITLSVSVYLFRFLQKRQDSLAERLNYKYLGLSSFGKINNSLILTIIKLASYSGRDLRAVWLKTGIPWTDKKKYIPLARWATQHWAMYFFFIDRIQPCSRVLDFGSGLGNMAANVAICRPDLNVTALDLNKQAIRLGHQVYSQILNLQFEIGNILEKRYKSKFDYCFLIDVLEHVNSEKHNELIEVIMTSLRSGGQLFLTTPNAREEKDQPYGHIGLLNSNRARIFGKNWRHLIVDFGYLDNSKLTTGDFKKMARRSDVSDLESEGLLQKYSHLYFVLKKR